MPQKHGAPSAVSRTGCPRGDDGDSGTPSPGLLLFCRRQRVALDGSARGARHSAPVLYFGTAKGGGVRTLARPLRLAVS